MADRDGARGATQERPRGPARALRRLDEVVLPRLGRGARRLARMRPLTAVALVGVLVVGGVAAWRVAQPHRPDLSGSGSPLWVGGRPGDSVPAYAAASRAELQRLLDPAATPAVRGQIYALVSLKTYLSPGSVTGLLTAAPRVTPLLAYARAQLPDRQTQIVRLSLGNAAEGLAEEMDEAADRKLVEAAADDRFAAALSPQPSPGVREQYLISAQVARDEAAAYRSHCSCVYALVVVATPAELAALAARPEVRIVDPAPEVTSLSEATFAPPLPEQTVSFDPPPDSALTGTPSPGGSSGPLPSSVTASAPAR
jgi:hypothetical protein